MSLRLTPTPHGYAMDLDIVGLLQGLNGQQAPAAPPAQSPVQPSAPAPTAQPSAPSRREQRRTARQAAQQSSPKGSGKADNKALYSEILSLAKTNPGAAAAKAAERGWDDLAARIRSKASEAQAATQQVAAKAARESRKSADLADKIERQVLQAAEQPAPVATAPSKGRSPLERCPVHNVFTNGKGVCKRCTQEAAVAAPQPKAGKAKGKGSKAKATPPKAEEVTQAVQAALPISALEAFPGGLTEGDLAIHWGNLLDQGHADLLRAAYDACTRGLIESKGGERSIWAVRRQTLANILGLKR